MVMLFTRMNKLKSRNFTSAEIDLRREVWNLLEKLLQNKNLSKNLKHSKTEVREDLRLFLKDFQSVKIPLFHLMFQTTRVSTEPFLSS